MVSSTSSACASAVAGRTLVNADAGMSVLRIGALNWAAAASR